MYNHLNIYVELHHVLDGGALIHRVEWQKGATFREITKSYVSCVH